MNYSDAERQKIIEYLKVKSIHHGQLDISQIYVAPKQVVSPPAGYLEVINHFQTNLHPIIVRRTHQYGEDQEYELIYGEDWYQAAKLAGLTKIWVWVFDLTNEQTAQVDQLMKQIGDSQALPPRAMVQLSTQEVRAMLTEIIDQKLSIFSHELDQRLGGLRQNFESKINEILEHLASPIPAKKLDKKSINEISLLELQNHPSHLVQKNAISIFNFIQNHSPIHTLKQLHKVKGVGDRTIEALAETYRV